MEPKKLPKLELGSSYTLFLNIGLIISLSVCLVAFEWKTYEDLSYVDEVTPSYNAGDDIEQVVIPPTIIPIPEPEKIIEKPQEKPDVLSEITEVLNDEPTFTLSEPAMDIPDIPIPAITSTDTGIPEEKVTDPIFDVYALEKEPEGKVAFYAYVGKQIKYPRAAQNANIQGTVYVQFVIDKDGSINDITVVKGIGYGCDQEAVRVIQQAPKWTPGKQRGKPVRVRMILPISFKLNTN